MNEAMQIYLGGIVSGFCIVAIVYGALLFIDKGEDYNEQSSFDD